MPTFWALWQCSLVFRILENTSVFFMLLFRCLLITKIQHQIVLILAQLCNLWLLFWECESPAWWWCYLRLVCPGNWEALVLGKSQSKLVPFSSCVSATFYCVTADFTVILFFGGQVQLRLLAWCWVGSTVSRRGGAALAVLLPSPGLFSNNSNWRSDLTCSLAPVIALPL